MMLAIWAGVGLTGLLGVICGARVLARRLTGGAQQSHEFDYSRAVSEGEALTRSKGPFV